ncbi:MAG: P-loop NTPase fold protein [Bacteroidota bacterium]|nr:P-loop NTPase fold protein [Bacteroidota bacterium]
MKNKIWGINWQIDRYADALFQLDKTGLGKTIWQLFFQPDSVEKQKDKLAESMKLLDKNLVVVVDDLDRLAKNEIADVLKLMRDTANFPNLVFIAAYDRNYLNEAIKEEINEHNYENYMDKIVLWEVPIYKPQPRKYIEILKNLLIERLSEFSEDIEDLFSENSSANTIAILSLLNKTPEKKIIETPDEINLELFHNIRVIKKFTNFIAFNIKLVKENTVFYDFYFLYLLRYFYKNYYDRFIIAYHELHKIKEGDIDTTETKIEKYTQIIFRESEIKENEKTVSIINAIISNMIDRSVHISSKSLIYYKNCLNYFHLGNHNDITMAEFSAMLKAKNFGEFKIKVEEMFKINNIIEQFVDTSIVSTIQENFNFKDTQSYIDYFKFMIWLAIKYNRPQFFQQCHYSFARISDHPIYSTKTKEIRNELKEFIMNEELQSDFQYFVFLIFQEIKSNPTKKTTYLAISDVFELAKSNFNNYISSGKDITPELINLFYCSYQSFNENGSIVDDETIISRMRNVAFDQPNKFIELIVVRDGNIKHSSDPDNYHYIFVGFLLKIFSSYNEFISFLKNTDFGNGNDILRLYLKNIDQAFPDKDITKPHQFLPDYNDYRNLFAGLDSLDVLLDWKLRAKIDEMMNQKTNQTN